MTGRNPYEAPSSQVADTAPVKATASSLPLALVFRWLLSIVLLAYGVMRLALLAQQWTWFSEHAVIDSRYSPYPWLLVELSVVATAWLLFRRSKWVFIPLLFHTLLFGWKVLFGIEWNRIPGQAFLVWMVEISVWGLCLWFAIKRRLR